MTRLNKIQNGKPILTGRKLKYGSKRTWSELCGRFFDSKAEARRGEELRLLEMAGEISDLRYQVKFILSEKPKVSIAIDFSYLENEKRIFEDVKGMGETREFRVKRLWLKQVHDVDVLLIKR